MTHEEFKEGLRKFKESLTPEQRDHIRELAKYPTRGAVAANDSPLKVPLLVAYRSLAVEFLETFEP